MIALYVYVIENDYMSETRKETVDVFRQIIDARNQAQQQLAEAENQLIGLLDENKDGLLPIKGKALYKMVEKNGRWQREFCDDPVIADEYVIGPTRCTDGTQWVLHVARPQTKDFEWLVTDVNDISFATPEEVAETRTLQEQTLEYARSHSGLGEVALTQGVPSRTPF